MLVFTSPFQPAALMFRLPPSKPPNSALSVADLLVSTLSVDTSKSATLNALFGGLLGGNLNINAAGWNGLVSTDISLLGYLDRLKVDLNLSAAGYDQVLGNTIAVSQLIQTAVNVLDPGGTLGATATIASLQALKVAAGATTVVLGNVLHVEAGSIVTALGTNLKVFDLIEAVVQLANKKNGLVATLPINLAGLAQITARVQVLEPPQLSAIGNPKNAALAPLGPNRIYVRTAQIRTLLSIDLPVLNTIVALINAAADLAGPLTNTLNALLNLNLVGVLNSLTCALLVPCQTPDIIVLPPPIRIDVALDVASANSYVTAYSCVSTTNKTLTTNTSTSLVNLKIGKIDPATAFGSNTSPPTPGIRGSQEMGRNRILRQVFTPISITFNGCTTTAGGVVLLPKAVAGSILPIFRFTSEVLVLVVRVLLVVLTQL